MKNNLREIRTEKGLSLVNVTQLTGISPADLSAIELGKRFPYPGWRRRIAEALELPEEEIFPGFAEVKQNDAR